MLVTSVVVDVMFGPGADDCAGASSCSIEGSWCVGWSDEVSVMLSCTAVSSDVNHVLSDLTWTCSWWIYVSASGVSGCHVEVEVISCEVAVNHCWAVGDGG